MKNLSVQNMRSNNGNDIANQFIINAPEGVYFQSYKSIIAFEPKDGSPTQLDEKYYNYSITTSKYRNSFLCCNSKEVEARIKSGEFILTNLN